MFWIFLTDFIYLYMLFYIGDESNSASEMYWCKLATSWWWSEFPTCQSSAFAWPVCMTRSCKQLVFWIRTSHLLMKQHGIWCYYCLAAVLQHTACVFMATVKWSALSGCFATMPSNVVQRVAAKRTARRTWLCKSWKRAATRGQSKEEATRRDICPYRLF